jgi:hypothetical protein
MSTHSNIGLIHADGSVSLIYCHHDGYPSHNGKILLEDYNTTEKVEALMALGDLSVLGLKVEKPVGHSFETPANGHCIAYGRDRGADGTYAMVYNSVDSADKEGCDNEYAYLFDSELKIWMYRRSSGKFVRLTPEVCVRD